MTKSKSSYKENLARKYEDNSTFLSTLNSSMQSRLNKVYSAFSGDYSYTDTHTGKTVKARTYKKRLSFVEKELEGIKRHIALQFRYNLISEEDKSKIENYLGELYSTAIIHNSYLKNKNVRRLAISERVQDSIYSLGPSIEDKLEIAENAKIMSAPTGFTNSFKENDQGRETSSSLYNRLRAIDSSRKPLSINASNDAKLPEDAPLVWPISREEELRLLNPRKISFKKIASITGLVVAGVAVGLTMVMNYFSSPVSTKGELSINPQYLHVNPNKEALPVEEPKISILNSIDPNKEALPEIPLNYTSNSEDVIEIARKRVAAAKKEIELEKTLQYTPEQLEERKNLAWQKVRQYELEIKQQKEREAEKRRAEQELVLKQIESRRAPFNWRKSFDAYWQRKSDKRALENIVVKTATFYPDGSVVVNYPLEKRTLAYNLKK